MASLLGTPVVGCGGDDGDQPDPTTLFSEDFSSSSLENWSLCDTSPPEITATGNPGPALLLNGITGPVLPPASQAATNQVFDASAGLTIEWDMEAIGNNATQRGGLSTATGCNGVASDTLAAGVDVIASNPGSYRLYLDGILIDTIEEAVPATFLRYKVRISSSGTVEYFVNDSHRHTSESVISARSPTPVIMQAAGGRIIVDNITVTTP